MLKLETYQDDLATFSFEASENKQYVIPQNHTMTIYGSQLNPFVQDTITILFRQLDVEKCESLNSPEIIELTMNLLDTTWRIVTPPGCQLIVTSITRKVLAVRHTFREKLLRYDPDPLFLPIHFNALQKRGDAMIFVETTADLPLLDFSYIYGGFHVF